jgi:hypothetical protein
MHTENGTITPRTVFHHDMGVLTAQEVRDRARAKLEEYIQKGKDRAEHTVRSIFEETPKDLYAPAERITVDYAEGQRLFRALIADRPALGLGQHATDQLAERVGLNTRFLHDLQRKGEKWAAELGAHAFNELIRHRPKGEKYLVRTVKDEGRAVLSDAYKCIDSRPTVDAMLGAVQKEGHVALIDGVYSPTRVNLKVVRLELVELFPGEWAVLGFAYENSDFGDGACTWTGFIERLLCLNGAMVATKLRKIHLGRRASDDVLISERTRRLSAETDASMARDMVKGLLSNDAAQALVDAVRAAHAKTIAPEAIDGFLKTRVNKVDAQAIIDKFTSADVVEVPAGQNNWRFSNAISWLARDTEDGRKKMELERLAGEALAV